MKSSGGPVLNAVDGKFEVVGLHRGGFNAGHCCGTKFSDILQNISGKVYKASMLIDNCKHIIMGLLLIPIIMFSASISPHCI